MKIFSLIMLYCLLSLNAFSQDIQAELKLISPPSILKEGDVVEGVLKVWPIENPDFNEIKKLENSTLDNALYVTEIQNIEVSANNADVVEAKLLIIVKRATEKSEEHFNYKGHSIIIQFPPLNIAPSEKDSENYYVLDQGVIHSNLWKIITGFFILITIAVVFLKRKSILHFSQKFRHDPIAISKKKFDEKFSVANKREDYEEIYALRNEWLSLIKELVPAYHEFFKTMEQHQYKKIWNSEDLNEVKNSFEIIQRSFK